MTEKPRDAFRAAIEKFAETTANKQSWLTPILEQHSMDAAVRTLNDRLFRIESFVASMPWKSETRVCTPDASGTLSLERASNGQWALWWSEFRLEVGFAVLLESIFPTNAEAKKKLPQPTSKVLLRDASLEAKAKACELIGKLIEQVELQADQRAQTTTQAHAALDIVEARLFGARVMKGGK